MGLLHFTGNLVGVEVFFAEIGVDFANLRRSFAEIGVDFAELVQVFAENKQLFAKLKFLHGRLDTVL